MYRCFNASAALLMVVALAPAQETLPGKLALEFWDAAYLDTNRAGYIHTTVHEYEKDGAKFRRTTVELNLTLKRFMDTIQQKMQTGTIETTDGKVTGVFMKQVLGQNQSLVLTGDVVGKELDVKVRGNSQLDRKIPWNDEVIGLYREHHIFKEKKAKPGDKFSYLHFEPMINSIVTIQVEVKDHEEIMVGPTKRKLLRVEATPDKIQNVQLPGTSFWLDPELTVVRSQVEMPGLGKLIMVRSTKDIALTPVVPAKITDIGLTQLISLNRPIAKVHDLDAAVYRITIPGDDEPASAIARDARQEVKNSKGKSFELVVKAVRAPKKMEKAEPVADEFMKSNYFINSDDAKVKDLAKKAVGSEADAWKKAQRIEKWVHDNMKIQNFTEAMATADHVAKTLEGDCTEYAMLTAAMCRAAGVPSRTALGLVYVDMRNRGPVLAYHMWTEVWIDGQWLALDATLGRGSIGVGHIKVADHSWHETRSMVPLLPVMRVMLGKMAVEVVQAGSGG